MVKRKSPCQNCDVMSAGTSATLGTQNAWLQLANSVYCVHVDNDDKLATF